MADRDVSQSIFESMQSNEISEDDKQKQLKYLIDYFVSKNHIKISPVGFLSGKRNSNTYCLSGLKYKEAIELSSELYKKHRIFNRRQSES